MYEKDIDFYRRYVCVDIWERATKKITNVFNGKISKRYNDFRFLTEAPVITKDKIVREMKVMSTEFDEKTSILQHLAAYKNETINKVINVVMLVLTITTLIFVIFPSLSTDVANFLLKIWIFIKAFFK